jgi:histidyl-tRNA synthetase
VEYFSDHRDSLDQENLDRLGRNPLRLLDSKLPDMAPLIQSAPQLTDCLDAESAEHFAGLQELLGGAGIPFTVNPRLVRGLDYYTRTVFEWVTDQLGAQGAVCAGGRYDGLVERLGGRATPAIGWAMGLERLIELVRLAETPVPAGGPDVYMVAVGDAAGQQALLLAEQLRGQRPQLNIEVNCGGGSFKSQFKRADKSGARLAVILGDEEVEQQQAGVKDLRRESEQQSANWTELGAVINAGLQNN